jgi:hypothetical protein
MTTRKIQLAETVPVPNLTVIMQFPVSRGDSILKASELPHNSLQKDG